MVCAKYEIMISAMVQSCMTPHEIAEKAGVSITSVYRVRKGYLVKMEILGKICKVLDLNCNEVIDFERLKKYRESQKHN
ncbi:uncharacterized protein BN724_00110 [Clostridium sp. CAG:590]|nr:uncharacterized protein BN724_00110 [Clostridium sp. CAG:590]